MTTETKRDLAMDLCFCEETEPTGFIVGPTTNEGTSLLSKEGRRLCAKTATVEIAEFIAEAREGWPHAIRMAISAEDALKTAEAEVVRLITALEETQYHLYREQYASATVVVDSALEVTGDGAA